MPDARRWSEHKARLSARGLMPAIFTQLDNLSFEPNEALKFEPLLVTRHSQRLSELMERCLAIRKDICELEVLSCKAATDYELFLSTSAIDEQTDVLRLLKDSKANEQAGFQKAAAAFKTTATLEKGLSEVAKGRDAALAEDLKTSDTLEDLIHNRWQTLRDYQDKYHARHTADGNAHNYGQRAERLLDVMTVLLQEALARAAVLAAGIQQIYGVEITDVPTSTTLATVDQFAVWTLRTIRALSHVAETEIVSELVVPLVQPWLLPGGQPLIEARDFDHAVAAAGQEGAISLTFNLLPNSLLDSRVRLKAIGIAFGNKYSRVDTSGIDRNQVVDSYSRLALKVVTPAKSTVLIGNVSLHGASPTSAVEGPPIENLSPFGIWKIEIHPFMIWKDGTPQTISSMTHSDPIRDLKLSLRFYVPGTYMPISSASSDPLSTSTSRH
jgi:hypothetical protein